MHFAVNYDTAIMTSLIDTMVLIVSQLFSFVQHWDIYDLDNHFLTDT